MQFKKTEQPFGLSSLRRLRQSLQAQGSEKTGKLLPDDQKTCTSCALHKSCVHSNNIPSDGAEAPTWMFVGEAPGSREDTLGKNFVGVTGELLRVKLKELGFPEGKCLFSNACRCWPGTDEKGKNLHPTDSQISACKKHLLKDIERYKPKVIIPLGNIALKACTGMRGITKLRGTVWKKDGITYAPTFHPSYINRDLTRIPEWEADLKRAYKAAEGDLPEPARKEDWITVTDFELARKTIRSYALCRDPITYDYEYEGECYVKTSKLLSVAFCSEPGTALCVPLQHKEAGWTKDQEQTLLDDMKWLVEYRNENRLEFIAYSAAAEIFWPAVRFGWPIPKPDLLRGDPFSAHHLIDETISGPQLRQLAFLHTNLGGYDNEMEQLKASDPKKYDPAKGGTYDNVPIQTLGYYNCGDADVTLRLSRKFEKIIKQEGLGDLYYNVVLPSIYPVGEYSVNGVAVDMEFAKELSVTYPLRMQHLVDEIRTHEDIVGYELWRSKRDKKKWIKDEKERIAAMMAEGRKPRGKTMPQFQHIYNPGSDDQTRELLFSFKKFKPVKLTPTRQPSVDKDVTEILKESYPLLEHVIEYGHLQKFKGTYVDGIQKLLREDGLAHFWFNPTGTVTGRLSSNFQQWPRSSTNSDLRKLIISRFGPSGSILEADVSQGELRAMAIASGDEAMLGVYRSGSGDLHRLFASWMYGIPESAVVDKQRSRSKSAIGFGVLYGRGAKALSEDLKIPIEEAQFIIDQYFALFPRVKKQIIYYRDFAVENGFVVNLLGRKRRLGEAQSEDRAVQEAALRQAVNFPIQSLLHDWMLMAQFNIWAAFRYFDLESKMVGEAHDSIVIDVYNPEMDMVLQIIAQAFKEVEDQFDYITIPLVVDAKAGRSWGEGEKLKIAA